MTITKFSLGRQINSSEFVSFYLSLKSNEEYNVVIDEKYLEKYTDAYSKQMGTVPMIQPTMPADGMASQTTFDEAPFLTALLILVAQLLDNDLKQAIVSPEMINAMVKLLNDREKVTQLLAFAAPASMSDSTLAELVLSGIRDDVSPSDNEVNLLKANTAASAFVLIYASYYLPTVATASTIMTSTTMEVTKMPYDQAVARVQYGSQKQIDIARTFILVGSDSKLAKRSPAPLAAAMVETMICFTAALQEAEAAFTKTAMAMVKRPLNYDSTMASAQQEVQLLIAMLAGPLAKLSTTLPDLVDIFSTGSAAEEPPALSTIGDLFTSITEGIPKALFAAVQNIVRVDDQLATEEKELKGAKFKGVQYALVAKRIIAELIDDDTDQGTPETIQLWAKSVESLQDYLIADSGSKKPKVAKGCIDVTPSQMLIREFILRKVKDTFQQYGAVQIDTPIFELMETLMGKYGEDSKLIYQLQDQGGEQLALRYDLTVPFARYVATNSVDSLRRYHIGKVYRRDEPQITKGRFREFYQCDIDVAGGGDCMIPEIETIGAWIKLMQLFEGIIGKFKVVLSHRKLLDGMMGFCGVPAEKTRAISSAIDKLDKAPWSDVRDEMIQKGLAPEVADAIRPYTEVSCKLSECLEKLETMPLIAQNFNGCRDALVEMQLFSKYLDACGMGEYVVFDMSLARGLDYYSGLIYEARLEDGKSGSIGAGGRYDGLIGMFSNKEVPAVGVSLGIERIFRLVEEKLGLLTADARGAKKDSKIAKMAGVPTDVYVITETPDMVDRVALASMLRNAGLVTEFCMKVNGKQWKLREDKGVSMAVYLNQSLKDNNQVELCLFNAEGLAERINIQRGNICDEVKKRQHQNRMVELLMEAGMRL